MRVEESSSILEEARALAGNLASLWNGGRDALELLTDAARVPDQSPWEAIQILGPDGVERVFAEPDARQTLHRAFQSLTRYLTAETWFDRARANDARLDTLSAGPVAYFCAEFGLVDWLPIYSGGLGVLAGDMLKEASDTGLPMVGVGLFYRRGFCRQRLNEEGYQVGEDYLLDPAMLPLTPVVDPAGRAVIVSVPLGERLVHARVWQLHVGRTTLFLLDTDTPENAEPEDRAITAQLYGGDQETRIRQEIVLGIGGVRTLRALGIVPNIYSMNEGHAAFLGLELVAEELDTTDYLTAVRRTRSRVVYTNHTVVPAGNDIFPADLVLRYLGPYATDNGIGEDRLLDVAGRDQFSMTILAFQMSGKANAVSELHGQVIPREWPGYSVEAVTNGVHAPTWVGPEMRAVLDTYVPDWLGDDPNWEAVERIPSDELWAARAAQRRRMIEFVNAHQDVPLDPNALTIVWARRFAEYKRAWLLASDLPRLARLLSNPEKPVQVVISGKAHPRDEAGKRVLQELLQRVKSEYHTASRVAFVPDYSIGVARYLAMGADIWLNTPRKPFEASGTSGMKSSDNAGLQMTVRDGWAAEVDWWDVGWGITGTDDAADAAEMYHYLEGDAVPSFYGSEQGSPPERWTAMMRQTMRITLSRFSARRMLLDYLHKLYLPLVEEQPVAGGIET